MFPDSDDESNPFTGRLSISKKLENVEWVQNVWKSTTNSTDPS